MLRKRSKDLTKRGFVGWKLRQQPPTQEQEPMKVLWMYLLHETYGGNGEDHNGAVLVSLSGEEQDAMWLPKTQIKRGGAGADGRVEITIPLWLAKERGLVPEQGKIPF
jgi:hypothetical protein